MTKEDAEIKAKTLSKDLVGITAEHHVSKEKFIVNSLEAVLKKGHDDKFEVICTFAPINPELSGNVKREELDFFLGMHHFAVR
jgi:hypothetical protein